jgi:replicative DNA helicase
VNQIPQDKRAEMALVGALMVHPESYDQCAPLISGKDFYDPTARAIWQAAERLHKKGIAIDPLTISSELPREVSRTAISGHFRRATGVRAHPIRASGVRFGRS